MGELRRDRIANLALFSARQTQLIAELTGIAGAHLKASRVLTVGADDTTGDGAVAARAGWRRRGRAVVFDSRGFEELGFLRVPISFREIERRLRERLAAFAEAHGAGAGMLLAVDMSWGLQTPSATANFGSWMGVAEALAAEPGVSVVSLYNRRLLIDEQLLAALRGHPGILTAAGVVANPHWLPAGLMRAERCASRWIIGSAPSRRGSARRRPWRCMPPRGRTRCGCCGARRRSRRRPMWVPAWAPMPTAPTAGRSAASAGCASTAATAAR